MTVFLDNPEELTTRGVYVHVRHRASKQLHTLIPKPAGDVKWAEMLNAAAKHEEAAKRSAAASFQGRLSQCDATTPTVCMLVIESRC
jgi:hypothetical protein